MNRLKRVIAQLKFTVNNKPWTLVLAVAFGFLLLMVGFEYARAKLYLNSADDYKLSSSVMRVKATADEINRTSQDAPPAVYCDVTHRELIGEFNEAYDYVPEEKELGSLITELNNSVKIAGAPPAFNSLLQFVPKVREARLISQDMHRAMEQLQTLTSEDVRATYCGDLVKVLRDVYFLSSIEAAEGVGALFVGQVENFQVNVDQALDEWAAIDPPSIFYDQHLELGKVLNSVKLNLRNDTNDNTGFSRAIEQDVEGLEEILAEIKNKSDDLLARPGQISLQAHYLE